MTSRAFSAVLVAGFVGGCGVASATPVSGKTLLNARPPDPAAATMATAANVPALPPDLHVRCDDPGSCPQAVGMVVFQAGDEAERCTATLVAPDRVITASHCVSPAARHDGASCAGAWIAFPARGTEPTLWARCSEVVHASNVGTDSVLRQEYAVLRLDRPLDRKPLELYPVPVQPGSIVTVVSVTPHPVYGSSHALRSRLCRVMSADTAEDALGTRASDVGWLSQCPIHPGNSGSPVLDYQGRVRAIVHGGTWIGFAKGVTSQVPRTL